MPRLVETNLHFKILNPNIPSVLNLWLNFKFAFSTLAKFRNFAPVCVAIKYEIRPDLAPKIREI